MTDLKKLRELAEGATPGPWTCSGGIYVYSRDAMIADNNDETALVRARGVGGGMSREQQEANVEFISSANPQAIIELLDRLERYENALRFYGNEKNWDDSFLLSMSDREPTTIHDECGGRRAREALEGEKK